MQPLVPHCHHPYNPITGNGLLNYPYRRSSSRCLTFTLLFRSNDSESLIWKVWFVFFSFSKPWKSTVQITWNSWTGKCSFQEVIHTFLALSLIRYGFHSIYPGKPPNRVNRGFLQVALVPWLFLKGYIKWSAAHNDLWCLNVFFHRDNPSFLFHYM